MLHRIRACAATKTGIFAGVVRPTVKLCLAAVAMAALLPAAPSYADGVAFVSVTGSGHACTVAQPCGDIADAYSTAVTAAAGSGVARVLCLTPVPSPPNIGGNNVSNNVAFEVNCPQGYTTSFAVFGSNTFGTLRGVTFVNSGNATAIQYIGSGTLILEDCAFTDQTNAALDIEPTGPLNLIIRNSRISNSGGGILLKPGTGGSIKATFDHVVITGNHGGGIRADSTNGVINLDLTNSEISNNTANGINAIGGAGGQNIVSIKNSVIARNGAAGVQAEGANAGVLIATTLLDQNTAGATLVMSGGNMFSYDNNAVIGPLGSGFTNVAPLQ